MDSARAGTVIITLEVSLQQEIQRPGQGTEREMLERHLDYVRAALIQKLSGLDRDEAGRHLVPSLTTLLGLLKHSTDSQEHWFRVMMMGESVPLTYYRVDDEDADWRVDADDTVQSVIAAFRETCLRADEAGANASLDDVAHGTHRTLRWIYLHMIQETARHCGHADILRELTDGFIGEQ